jgi:hypothetical protein
MKCQQWCKNMRLGLRTISETHLVNWYYTWRKLLNGECGQIANPFESELNHQITWSILIFYSEMIAEDTQ